MEKDSLLVGQVFEDNGIAFSFANLKNLSNSEITYPQFLACVAQRILLKQYAAQTMDNGNFLCPMSRTSEIFNKNKASFSSGINDLFLKPMTLSIINSQTSKNKVTKEEQVNVAIEFVKWYDSTWFNRLKSEEFLGSIADAFGSAVPPKVEGNLDDWETLSKLYGGVNDSDFFDEIGVDSKVFINNADSIQPKWFDGILDSSYKFMKLTGNVELSQFNTFVSNEDLVVPTTSSFMLSTLYGIEEIEDRKKKYNAPFDPYNMFYIFKGTSISNLLKMNQFMFTLYNYFKILL
jgi:hypothetical protein